MTSHMEIETAEDKPLSVIENGETPVSTDKETEVTYGHIIEAFKRWSRDPQRIMWTMLRLFLGVFLLYCKTSPVFCVHALYFFIDREV